MKTGKLKKALPAIAMIGPIAIWMTLFVAIPLIYVFAISFLKKAPMAEWNLPLH